MRLKQKPGTSRLGKIAEEYACNLLVSRGYKILEKNFRSRFGEIDAIALKDTTLIFVEVKARWSLKFGKPEEAVTAAKLSKIKKTGEYYSLLNPNMPQKLGIHIVSLEIEHGKVISARIIEAL